MDIRIKDEFKKTVVGYNNSAAPLGERTDLDVLARIAQESQDPSLLKLFDGDLPALKELKKKKTDSELPRLSDLIDPNIQNPGFETSDAHLTK